MREYHFDLEMYDETKESLNMYRWLLGNSEAVCIRITATVESELMNATAASSFTIQSVVHNNVPMLMS